MEKSPSQALYFEMKCSVCLFFFATSCRRQLPTHSINFGRKTPPRSITRGEGKRSGIYGTRGDGQEAEAASQRERLKHNLVVAAAPGGGEGGGGVQGILCSFIDSSRGAHGGHQSRRTILENLVAPCKRKFGNFLSKQEGILNKGCMHRFGSKLSS